MTNSRSGWLVGADAAPITPQLGSFLFGYPRVPRQSTAVHDPLWASAVCFDDGRRAALFIGCDVIWVPRDLAARARLRIAAATGIAVERIMVTATHTHSGPVTARMLSNEHDPVVPAPDAGYLDWLEAGIVRAASSAWAGRRPATLGFSVADCPALGGNRRDPTGPALPQIPVLYAEDIATRAPLAIMAVVSMHPTVLHEDWQFVSGDFPGLARLRLQESLRAPQCPVVFHMGASGNQSPRHAVTANTIAEAQRLGEALSQAVVAALGVAQPIGPARVECLRSMVDLPLKTFPPLDEAQASVVRAVARLESLRRAGAARSELRTAECDVFGAEEALTLAKAAAEGRLAAAAGSCLPAEVQVIALGDQVLVGWPGEVFVEFALEIRRGMPQAWVITLANGELQGYLATQAAVDEGGYEASNALFASPESGRRLVEATLALIGKLGQGMPHAARSGD